MKVTPDDSSSSSYSNISREWEREGFFTVDVAIPGKSMPARRLGKSARKYLRGHTPAAAAVAVAAAEEGKNEVCNY